MNVVTAYSQARINPCGFRTRTTPRRFAMPRAVSPITQKGYRKGHESPNRGKRFYADVYTREEVMALVDANNVGTSGLNRSLTTEATCF